MTKFVATVNIPGYLPEGDAVVFDTPAGAWEYLAEERERAEDETYEPGGSEEYSETLNSLRAFAKADAATTGAIYGGTPGYDGDHDLGLAYHVTEVSDSEAAEIEATQG